MKVIIAILAWLGLTYAVLAQTSPGFTGLEQPTASQWNALFAGKQDYPAPPFEMPQWDTAHRPPNPRPGDQGFNTDTFQLEYWNSTEWIAGSNNTQLESYGGVGDAIVTDITLAAGQKSFSGQDGAPKPQQSIVVPGVGPGGSPFISTFASSVALTDAPTYSTGTYYATFGDKDNGTCPLALDQTNLPPGVLRNILPGAAGGSFDHSYAVGDTVSVAGGTLSTPSAPTSCMINYTTAVAVQVVASGTGTGNANQVCVVRGTTGAGITFHAMVTLDATGKMPVGPAALTAYGAYSAQPTGTAPAGEPVQAINGNCGNVADLGARMRIATGIFHAYRVNDGNYIASPISGGGVGQGNVSTTTSGAGLGAQLSITYLQSGVAVQQGNGNWIGPTYGTDNTPAMVRLAGDLTDKVVWVPGTNGAYLFTSCQQITIYANNTRFIGTDRINSKFILRDECSVPDVANNSWLYFNRDKQRASFENMTIDFRFPLKVTGTRNYYGLLWTKAAGTVRYTNLLNGNATFSHIGQASGVGSVSTSPEFTDNYIQRVADIQWDACMTFSASGGSIDKPRVANNTVLGCGIQMDGQNFLFIGNNVSGWSGGAAVSAVANNTDNSLGSRGVITSNYFHDSLNVLDMNGTVSEGAELNGPNVVFTNNTCAFMAGSCVVNFGPSTLISGNSVVGISQGSQLGSPFTAYVASINSKSWGAFRAAASSGVYVNGHTNLLSNTVRDLVVSTGPSGGPYVTYGPFIQYCYSEDSNAINGAAVNALDCGGTITTNAGSFNFPVVTKYRIRSPNTTTDAAASGTTSVPGQSGIPVVNTGISTNEVSMASIEIPPMGPNDSLRITTMWDTSASNPTNKKILFVKWGRDACPTPLTACSPLGNATPLYIDLNTPDQVSGQIVSYIRNANSQQAQVYNNAALGKTGIGFSDGQHYTATVNTMIPTFVNINSQTFDSSGDTITLLGYTVEVIPGNIPPPPDTGTVVSTTAGAPTP